MKYIIRSGLKRGAGQYWSMGGLGDYWSSASRAQTASVRRFDTAEEAKAAFDEALDSPLHEYGLVPDGCRVVRLLSHAEAKRKRGRPVSLATALMRAFADIDELKAELEKVKAERQAYALSLCEEIIVDAEKGIDDPMKRWVIEEMRRGIEARRT